MLARTSREPGMKHETLGISNPVERRHSPNRRRTRVDALADIEGALHTVTILDVSFEGMKLAVPALIFPGTPIAIQVMDHRLRAIVHWYRLGHVGVHLLDRLDARTLLALEQAHDEFADYR